MLSALSLNQAGQQEIHFQIPLNLAPVFLAFKLVKPGGYAPLQKASHLTRFNVWTFLVVPERTKIVLCFSGSMKRPQSVIWWQGG
jgi:hypothetical protein